MESTQKKTNTLVLIAGILFAVRAVLTVFPLGYFTFAKLLYIAGYAAAAFCLITDRRDIVSCAAFGALLLAALFSKYWVGALGYAIATLICVASLTDYLPSVKEIAKKIWFVPAILLGIGIFTNHIFGFIYIVRTLIFAAEMLAAMLWAACPEKLPEASGSSVPHTASSGGNGAAVTDEMYCGLVKHILLLLFTCGIWLLIWIYRMTGYTNCVTDEEERNPTTKLLLCMFVPFYQIYWTYKTAQRVDKMASAKGLASDLSTLCLILAIFVPIIPPILMQDKLNNIVTAGAGTAARPSYTTPEASKAPVVGVAEELKNYKELLDSGVITQEEFEAKKKQLLGL